MICDALSFPWAIMQLEWIGLKIKLQGLFEKIKKVCFKNISFKAISSFFVREGPDGPNQWQRENQIDVWRWIEWKLWQIRSIKFEVNIRWRKMGGDQSTQMESHFWRLIFIRLIKKLPLLATTKDLAAIFYQIYVTIPTSDNTTQLPMQARKPKHNHTMQLMLNVPKTKVADQCTDWNDYILAVNEWAI